MSLSLDLEMRGDPFGIEAERAEALAGLQVTTGLHDPEQARKGAIHEWGATDTPARPWVSLTIDAAAEAIGADLEAMADRVLDGASPSGQLAEVGGSVAERLRDTLVKGKAGGPPLSPATIRAKGHATKLVDSGEMLGAIGSKVGPFEGDGDGQD